MFRSVQRPSPLLGALGVAVFAGCVEAGGPAGRPTDLFERVLIDEGDAVCRTLYAGQTIVAGTVCVTTDGDENLFVTYQTTGGWQLVETHLWIDDDFATLPTNRKGNPQIGLFPYASGDITGATSWTFTIPLVDLGITDPDACEPTAVYAAAHAALRKPNGTGGYQTETGWGAGTPLVDRGNWATFFATELTCEQDPEEPPVEEKGCETLFAYDAFTGQCFLDYVDADGKPLFNRWGWVNGPYPTDGTIYPLDLYAGAGQCDREKGTLVGEAAVSFDDKGAWSVQYQMYEGFELEETHLYVGTDEFPTKNGEPTVAPGQFPYIHTDLKGASSDTFTGVYDGTQHLIAHGVVCSDVFDPSDSE